MRQTHIGARSPQGHHAPNEKAPHIAAQGQKNQTEHLNSAGDQSRDQAATEQHKQLSTLQARYAMAGFGLHALADGSYLACRWNLSRSLPTLEAAGAFLRMIGGNQ